MCRSAHGWRRVLVSGKNSLHSGPQYLFYTIYDDLCIYAYENNVEHIRTCQVRAWVRWPDHSTKGTRNTEEVPST